MKRSRYSDSQILPITFQFAMTGPTMALLLVPIKNGGNILGWNFFCNRHWTFKEESLV